MNAPLCVDSDQSELLPTSVYDVLHPEIELTTHDCRVWFPGKTVKMLKTNGIDLVVDVETGLVLTRIP